MVTDTYIALFPNVHDSSRHRISISRAEGGNYIWTLAFQSLNRRRGCDLWPRIRYSKTLKKKNQSIGLREWRNQGLDVAGLGH
jgi:hypothetical protein